MPATEAAELPAEVSVVLDVSVVAVAGEQLVGPLSGKDNLDMLGSQASGEVGGNGAAHQVLVERLEEVDDAGEVGGYLGRREQVLVVDGSQVTGRSAGRFQVRAALRSDREGVELIKVRPDEGGDGAAVEAAGEECSERDVTHEPLGYGIGEAETDTTGMGCGRIIERLGVRDGVEGRGPRRR